MNQKNITSGSPYVSYAVISEQRHVRGSFAAADQDVVINQSGVQGVETSWHTCLSEPRLPHVHLRPLRGQREGMNTTTTRCGF